MAQESHPVPVESHHQLQFRALMTKDLSSEVYQKESSKIWQSASLGRCCGSILAALITSVAFTKDEEFGEYADIPLERLIRFLVVGLSVACQFALMLALREGMEVDIFSFDLASVVYSVLTVVIMMFISTPVRRYFMDATGLPSFAQNLHARFETKEDDLEQQNSSLVDERSTECSATSHAKLPESTKLLEVHQPQRLWGGVQTATKLLDVLE